MWKPCWICHEPQESEHWVNIDPNHIPHRKNGRFRVVSYNILARWRASSPMCSHSPPDCIRWDNRSKAILDNIKSFEADFICLQEVEEYDSFFKRIMGAQGYSGIYFEKGEDHKRDGVAIFYKPKFAEVLDDEEIIVLNDRGITQSTRYGEGLNCDSVAILAAFKISKPFNHVVIIANAHLKSGEPDVWGDVRLAQTNTLMLYLAFFWRRVSSMYECSPSVILAGDFNSNPSSEVYEYLNSKTISLMRLSPLGESLGEDPIDFELRSVYGHTKGEPMFTKYVPGFAETMDYVFFKPSEFSSPVKLLELPEVVDFLPNEAHPSDHLPIGVEFELHR